MRTLKVIGSGPMTGLVFYCTLHPAPLTSMVDLETDEVYVLPNGWRSKRLAVNVMTGAVFTPYGVETDLLRVSTLDMPRLQDEHQVMSGKNNFYLARAQI